MIMSEQRSVDSRETERQRDRTRAIDTESTRSELPPLLQQNPSPRPWALSPNFSNVSPSASGNLCVCPWVCLCACCCWTRVSFQPRPKNAISLLDQAISSTLLLTMMMMMMTTTIICIVPVRTNTSQYPDLALSSGPFVQWLVFPCLCLALPCLAFLSLRACCCCLLPLAPEPISSCGKRDITIFDDGAEIFVALG